MTDTNDNEARGTQLLMDMIDANTEALIAAGIDSEAARVAALKAIDFVRKNYGGETIYITKGVVIDVTKKHWQIWDEFTGGNKLALAKKYNLSVRMIEKIIARCRSEWDKRHQFQMFD